MQIRRWLVPAVLGAILAGGCSRFAEPDRDPGPSGGSIVLNGDVPASVRDREPLPSCGVETATNQGGPWNIDGRRCLAAAYRSGSPAEFVSTRPTIEGDPFRVVYRVLGPGRVEILVDSTRDAWSDRSWSRMSCSRLTIDETATPGPDFGWGDDCASATIE